MVGIPRSKGCRICVQRRVKCDLTRPRCNNCLKGNRPCPGYDSNLRIHDEGARLRERFGQKAQTENKSDADTESSPSNSGHSQSSTSSPEASLEIVSAHTSSSGFDASQAELSFSAEQGPYFALLEQQISPDADFALSGSTAIAPDGLLSAVPMGSDLLFNLALNGAVYSPYIAQEQLLDSFTSAIFARPGQFSLPRQMQSHGRWLRQLPALFGTKLLDSSVRAVSLVHLGRTKQSEFMVHESRRFYGNALRQLNKALTDQQKGMSTETLSATILLSFYEMFASDSNESWVRHAGGAGTLMRIRGPRRHLYGVDRDVFLSYRYTIVIDAFQRDEACFLAEPAWLEVAHQIHDDLRASGMGDDQMALFDLAQEFYLEYVLIPGTSRDARYCPDVRKVSTPEAYREYECSVRERCLSHRAVLKLVNLRFRAAVERLGFTATAHETNDPVFPTQYTYASVFLASTNVGYCTILLLMNIILKELEQDSAPEKMGLYLMENLEIAREICRSTAFMMTSSFLGPFFVIFALRLCLMVFEPGDERNWVLRKLFQIGQTHMKMAADIPNFEPEGTPRTSPKTVTYPTRTRAANDSGELW